MLWTSAGRVRNRTENPIGIQKTPDGIWNTIALPCWICLFCVYILSAREQAVVNYSLLWNWGDSCCSCLSGCIVPLFEAVKSFLLSFRKCSWCSFKLFTMTTTKVLHHQNVRFLRVMTGQSQRHFLNPWQCESSRSEWTSDMIQLQEGNVRHLLTTWVFTPWW